ncbi:peptidase S41, partial [Flavihumibacter sediminis]|nr:peptidase S41 [Flavihumibacter sediminis]
FRSVLEESHPSLYWYTPKDSMDYYFDWGYRQLTDSMTEPQFRSVLSYVIAKVKCGHTSTRYSRKFLRFLDTARLPQFPITIKALDNDTIVINNNLQKGNLLVKRGTILTSLNKVPIKKIVDSLARHIPSDGNNVQYLMQTLSNRGAF